MKRKLLFYFYNVVLFWPLFAVFWILMRTWRIDEESKNHLRDLLRSERIVIGCLHGAILSFAPVIHLGLREGRCPVILSSPSRDGLIVDRIVTALGGIVVKGSGKSRASGGLRALVRSTKEGNIAFTAVDGPRGPIGKLHPGVLTVANSANADFYLAALSADRAKVFSSWDRMFLPLPFTTIRFRFHQVDIPETKNEYLQKIPELEKFIEEKHRELGSPIFPDKRS